MLHASYLGIDPPTTRYIAAYLAIGLVVLWAIFTRRRVGHGGDVVSRFFYRLILTFLLVAIWPIVLLMSFFLSRTRSRGLGTTDTPIVLPASLAVEPVNLAAYSTTASHTKYDGSARTAKRPRVKTTQVSQQAPKSTEDWRSVSSKRQLPEEELPVVRKISEPPKKDNDDHT